MSSYLKLSPTLLEYVLKLILSLKTRVLESTKTSSQWPSAHVGKLDDTSSVLCRQQKFCVKSRKRREGDVCRKKLVLSDAASLSKKPALSIIYLPISDHISNASVAIQHQELNLPGRVGQRFEMRKTCSFSSGLLKAKARLVVVQGSKSRKP